MGLSAKVGSFNTGTGALNSTVVINDVGFQPKVIFFWWNGRTGTVDASGRATHQRGFGVATSTTDRRYITSLSQDTPTSMVTNEMQGNAQCIGITTTADAIDGLMDVSSIDTGGFTLIVDDVFTASYRIHYLALGGTDITNVATGQFTGNAAGVTGTQDITSLAFQPDFVMVFSTGQTTANNTVRADSRMTMGMATASNSGVWAGGSNDGAANAQAMAYCKTAEFISHFNAGVTGFDDRATFSSFLSNGFRISWSTVTTGGSVNFFVAMKGGQYRVDHLLTQVDTTTPIAETGFGFSPKGVLTLSATRAESTANTPTDDDEWSMGAFTGTTARASMSISDDDAAGTAVVGTGVSHDEAYQNLNATTGAVEGEMDVQSIDSDGFTMIMDDADPAQACVLFAAFGQSPLTQTVSGGITPAGAVLKQGNKTLTGGNTPAGTVLKLTSKSYAGGMTPSGALIKTAQKTLAGAISSIVGTLATARIMLKTLAGSITPSGLVSKLSNKTLAGSISSIVGSISKQGQKTLAGTNTPSGTSNKNTIKSFAGNITPSGDIIKTTLKFLSGAITSAGTLVGDFISGSQTFFQELSGGLGLSGTISKLTGKTMEGGMTPSGSESNTTSKLFGGTLTSAGAFSKIPAKQLAGEITSSGQSTKQTSKSFAGTLTSEGTLLKRIEKFLSGILTSAGDLATNFFAGGTTFFKSLFGGISPVGDIGRDTSKSLSGQLDSEGSIVKSTTKSFSGTLSSAGGIFKGISKLLSGILNSIGTLIGVNVGQQSISKIYLEGDVNIIENLEGTVNQVEVLTGSRTYTVRLRGKK